MYIVQPPHLPSRCSNNVELFLLFIRKSFISIYGFSLKIINSDLEFIIKARGYVFISIIITHNHHHHTTARGFSCIFIIIINNRHHHIYISMKSSPQVNLWPPPSWLQALFFYSLNTLQLLFTIISLSIITNYLTIITVIFMIIAKFFIVNHEPGSKRPGSWVSIKTSQPMVFITHASSSSLNPLFHPIIKSVLMAGYTSNKMSLNMDLETAKIPGSGSRSLSRYRHSLTSHKPIPLCLPSMSV